MRADFIERVPGVPVDGERDEVLERLRPHHEARVREMFGTDCWWRAEQVHGAAVAVVGSSAGEAGEKASSEPLEGVDGLVTDQPGEVLGIYVADCGPIWLADRRTGAVGLLHSGKKGTEGNILEAGVRTMSEAFGTRARDVVAVLGPCIRPPHYEVDIAARIAGQAEDLGLGDFRDSGVDTAADLDRWYSYRMEKGRTGRMLALIMREGAA
ncbi:polyphenol oxidase family protein [Haloferula sp. A504]|uniref:polyphenol oxidase family protein n=1 Tax=Haloferula sp. A504 TaxID=3373601 RepID=UPI0031C13DBF|nr:polyphenol oxidase family protein [Verrucomicrobiaceae bacterium E54]